MKKKSRFFGILTVFLICTAGIVFAGDTEIAGVKFLNEKAIAGKTLELNGVAVRKALVVVKVFAGGLYL